ncbi:MAG: type IV secretion system DNA-binding domain-containing protein [Planctomycetes bacterium]|nr:type IV secretion system DNA-binding domain-containing protein [Planctomycetota bacterium]
MPDFSSSVPDSWDFGREFLADPEFLPAYVDGAEQPAIAPSSRAERPALRNHFHLTANGLPPVRDPHAVFLPEAYAVFADRHRGCNDLLGPALLQFSEELLNRHLLLVGPPGTGKTSQVLTPMVRSMIADPNRTVVLFDPKGDQFQIVRELARQAGRPARSVRLLNLSDPKASVGWNPLHRDLTRTEAHGIATALVMAVEVRGGSDTPFWRNNAVELLTNMLLGLVGDQAETATLPRICEVLDLPRPELFAWLRAHGCHKFSAFLESGSHNAETCLSDTSMRLVSLLDLDLCAVLSHDELRVEDLFRKPSVLVVEVDETRIDRLRGMFNMLVQRLLDCGIAAASRHPDARLRFPVSIVIDEFGSAIGAVPKLPTYLNTVRSRRIGIVAAVQSVAQIQALYGAEAGAVLAGFSSKVFFGNVERIDAMLASELCGTMAARLPAPDGGPGGWVARPVYLPEEVSRPKEHPSLGRPVLMVLADMKPTQVYLMPAYRLDGLRDLLVVQRRGRRRPRRRMPLAYVPREQSETAPAKVGAETVPSISNTKGWTMEQILARLAVVKLALGWDQTTGSARKWWEAFERENLKQMHSVLRLAEELAVRQATVTEFFLAYVYSNCDDIQASLHYLDYLRLKKKDEEKKAQARAAAAKARGESEGGEPTT